MDVLVTESIAGAAQAAVTDLEAAGHRVHRCHEEGAPLFPCAGLATDACPLDAGAIDLVLAVRPHVRTNPAAGEDGVTCGLRRRIPVAVYGQPVMNPFEAFGADAVEGDLVGECERIAAARRPGHEAVAREIVVETLLVEEMPTANVEVVVRRVADRLQVEVLVDAAVSPRAREILAVRVVGRLREYDTGAGGIDVSTGTVDAPV
jgi:hypothetical protein